MYNRKENENDIKCENSWKWQRDIGSTRKVGKEDSFERKG